MTITTTSKTVYRMVWDGMTYDNDYAQRIKITLEFDTLEEAIDFREQFPFLCGYLGILEKSNFNKWDKPYVDFRDVDKLVDDGILPEKYYYWEFAWYNSGYVYVDENAEIEEVVVTTTKTRHR